MDAPVITRPHGEQGTTIVEVVIASAILVTLMAGLMSLAGLAISTTENQGHLGARTTEYAQDKMEQLLAIAYTDQVANTVTFPATFTGGTGLVVGGSSNTAAPVNGYVDWLAQDGSLLGGGAAPPATWFYERVWRVTQAFPGVKQISVTATVRSSVGHALVPKSTVVALKASQF
jgi:hypothetical protein